MSLNQEIVSWIQMTNEVVRLSLDMIQRAQALLAPGETDEAPSVSMQCSYCAHYFTQRLFMDFKF